MKANPTGYLWSKYECFLMSGCQDMDFNASVTRARTRTRTGTWTTGVTAIALCISCSRAKNHSTEIWLIFNFKVFGLPPLHMQNGVSEKCDFLRDGVQE